MKLKIVHNSLLPNDLESIKYEKMIMNAAKYDFSKEASGIQAKFNSFLGTIYNKLPKGKPMGKLVRRVLPKTPQKFQSYVHGHLNGRNIRPISLVNSNDLGFGILTSDKPKVSVVIPVHDNWHITRKCLESIRLSTNNVEFEILVVDDCSTDQTAFELLKIRGITVVTKPSNTGYLDSTNIGATYARGEYLLLLNNDTEPTNGWLDALVETIDSDITIGAVGSKLIYSNGFMQEAGAQVFNDGSAWNLGRHVTSLFDGSISSIREVDYCSAACLLIRKKTWDELEGFDRRFAPAYYEDTDLCMRIWNNGERVVYQPNSLVIHHEGLSHGRNEFTGLKAHQQKNKITFFQKWENTLESHWSAELAPRLEYRRDSRGIVVIIDSQLPSDLRDSGSQRTFALIKSLQDLGFHVILGALDSSTTPGSIYGLRMNGVEVHYLIEDLINSLESRKHRLRLFWLIRENVITSLELKLKSKFSSIEIIADLLDLDFKVTGNGEFIISASQMKIINNYKKVVLVSPLEVQLAKEKSKSSSIFPIWTEFETQHIPSLPKKNNFLFIGGFRHPPNVEAIDWLIHEIVPEFRLLNSETPISIIGSGLDGYRVALLNSLGINYLGTIQDLKSAYASAVASLAPLKSGRGLKGKIGEAMSYGVPVIGTSISFDGFQIQNRVNALIADDAKSFAELMNELVKNQEFRSELSLEALNWHKNFYGPGTLKGQIRTLLDTP